MGPLNHREWPWPDQAYKDERAGFLDAHFLSAETRERLRRELLLDKEKEANRHLGNGL